MINSDDIIRNGFDWGSVDNFAGKLKDREPIIVNTDISSGQGIHFFTVIPIDDVLFIIDSLGTNNYRPYDDIMFREIEQTGLRPVFFNGRMQFDNDSLCGWFSLFNAYLLKNYQGHLTLAIANKLIENAFGHTADDGDIHKLIDMFGLKK